MKPKGSGLGPVRDGRVLNLEKFRVKKRLEDCGLEWHEDTQGKVRIWIRLRDDNENMMAANDEIVSKNKILPFELS